MKKFPKIDGYQVDCLLGSGGQGAVFGGRRLSDDRKVAIKVLHDRLDENHLEAVSRFRREIEVSKNFAHANVIRILDGGLLSEGEPFLVMDYLEGESLLSRLMEENLTAEELQPLYMQLAEALDYIHSQGLLHRDIKPANVWLRKDGQPILLDFGLCYVNDNTRITDTGVVVGTVATMAPEQLQAQEFGPYTDIYSLGATMYCAATGDAPYKVEDLLLIGVGRKPRLIESPCDLMPAFPPHLSSVIMKSICLYPRERFQTAAELKDALLEKDGHTSESVVIELEKLPPQKPARNPTVYLGLLLLLLFMFALHAMTQDKEEKKYAPTTFTLAPSYKQLLAQRRWTDEELKSFGRKVIAMGRVDKFDITDETDDPFVVGCYCVINGLSPAIERAKIFDRKGLVSSTWQPKNAKTHRLAANLFLRLFDRLGERALFAPNPDFMRLMIKDNHMAGQLEKVIARLEKLLNKVERENERLCCEFWLAEALFHSTNFSHKALDGLKAADSLIQSQWLIKPAIDRFYKGKLQEIEVNYSAGELLSRYAELLALIRTKESKRDMDILIAKIDGNDSVDQMSRAFIYNSASFLASSPIRGAKEVKRAEIEKAIKHAKSVLQHANGKQRAQLIADMLAHAHQHNFYAQLKKSISPIKVTDFPFELRHHFYLFEADQAMRNNDKKRAMALRQKAHDIAPAGEMRKIELRKQSKMSEIFGIMLK